MLLFGFSFLVRSDDSPNDFRINQGWALEHPKNRINGLVLTGEAGQPTSASLRLSEIHRTVRRGDTFSGIVSRLEDISAEEVRFWLKVARVYPNLSRIHPDRGLVFLVDSERAQISGLQYEVSATDVLTLRRDGSEIIGALESLPVTTEVRVTDGRIQTSLYQAAVDGGVPYSVISSFIDIFSWEIDFTRDIRPGYRFRVAYSVTHDSRARGFRGGRVLAAEIQSNRGLLQAVYFEDENGGSGYYAPDGKPLSRAFLRYPLEFTRISSQFMRSRFHPVLGVRKPHLGVDFAAPVGTPVRAIGHGQIEVAHWNGGNGRFVKITHKAGLASSYSHLRSIAPEIRPGAVVQRGQLIGTVGASGLVTGPHLHFALYRKGFYVNPMKFHLPSARG